MHFAFQSVLTGGPSSFNTGISDLDIRESGGQIMLFTASGPSGGVLCYEINGSSVSFTGQEAFSPGQSAAGSTGLEEVNLNGANVLVTVGHHTTAPERFDLNAAGEITGTGQFQAQGGFGGAVVSLETLSINGEDYVYTGEWSQSGPVAYKIGASGTLDEIQNLGGASAAQGPDLIEMETVLTGGQTFLMALSAQGNAITSYAVGSDGRLAEGDTFGAAEGVGINDPTAMARTTVDGTEYLLVSAARSGSISALEVAPDGTLTATDHILGDAKVPLSGVSSLEVITVEGRSFVVTGGGDGGLSLFTLMPGGRLLHLSSFQDTASTALSNVESIALHAANGSLEVFASSQAEAGVTHLSVDISNVAAAINGTAGGDALSGSAADDYISGGAGDDSLNGGAGDDILVDGAGQDTLTGGSGADIFVITDLSGNEVITDFELGVDRLDLSAIGWIRNLSQIDITATSTGARLEYAGKTITLNAHNGQPIDPASLRIEDLIDLSHFVFDPTADTGTGAGPTAGDDTLTGGSADDQIQALAGDDEVWGLLGNDVLEGGDGDDTLNGAEDNDTLIGGAGADDLRGGPGLDTAYYVDAAAAVGIAVNGDPNWGWAVGDTFSQIENLVGGNFNDTLVGNEFANVLDGWAGNDLVYAGNGHDLVIGGGGNDLLNGDNENDTVIGGDGNDTLTGGRGDDSILGENDDDVLWGWLGLDTIIGGPGNDQIFGEEDSDYIDGWSDDDSLFGGAGWDTIIGGDGNDLLNGDGEDDTLLGGDGQDTLAGGHGNDYAHGENGNDLLFGWLGRDVLEGGSGNDTLNGEENDDTVSGGAGDDLVIGGTGNDLVVGWLDNDTLDGGAGDDTLMGEQGDDLYVFFDGHGNDTIIGFEANNDAEDIDLAGISAITDFNDLRSNHMSQQGDDVLIDTGTGTIRLLDVSLSDLDNTDFIF